MEAQPKGYQPYFFPSRDQKLFANFRKKLERVTTRADANGGRENNVSGLFFSGEVFHPNDFG